MRAEADGFGYVMNGDRNNGGYSGYGTGASSALPGASWLLPSRPFGIREAEPDSGRHIPVSSIPLPFDTTPSIPADTTPISAPPKIGDETGSPPPTDTQRLIDAFRAMFGTPERRNRNDGSVILVDAGQQGGGAATGGGVSPVAVAVLLGAGVGGWWLWRRYGRKAVAT